jgi:hypothetical protein
VVVTSPAGVDVRGRATVEKSARPFRYLADGVDLVDEHVAVDRGGNGRAAITWVVPWKPTRDGDGLRPTGRDGASVETLLVTVASGQIVRIDVADHRVDVALYQCERGWPTPGKLRAEPIVVGIDRGELQLT